MDIYEYIAKHELKFRMAGDPFGFLGAVSNELTDISTGSGAPRQMQPGDKFQFYANDAGTHIVSVNTTTKQFRIIHCDLVPAMSDWCDVHGDYYPLRFEFGDGA